MPPPYDAVIIGGGHNGLVTAAYLARAGLATVVVERSDRVGGCAANSVLAPGFVCPTLTHRATLDPAIIRELGLEGHGLEILRAPARVCAPTTDGRALTLWADEDRATRDIAGFSMRDAGRYPAWLASMGAIGRVLDALLRVPPPQVDHPGLEDLVTVLRAGRAFRALAKADAHRLLRWLPMPAQDFVSEWFESEPLRVTLAASGTFGALLGPRSAGSAARLLLLGASEGCPVAPGWAARGSMEAVADTLTAAGRKAGVEIRTGAEVRAITVQQATAKSVVLSNGDEILGRRVVSNVDPKRTLLGLIDPAHLTPEFLQRVRNIRTRGTLAKVNFAVSELPTFAGLTAVDLQTRSTALSGSVRLAENLDSLERAFDAANQGKVGEAPWIELAIPSILDGSLAPEGRHVVSAYAQFAPYELRGTTWDAERDLLGQLVARRIAEFAPGFERSILARQVITPLDLERTYGLTGGHIFHGELALDQILSARPFLGWRGYRTPIKNLYLCGTGVHPGTGLDGRSGRLAARAILSEPRD